VRFQGLPARVAWFPERQLGSFGGAINDLVARGELRAPILLCCRFPLPEWNGAIMANFQSPATWVWIGAGGDPSHARMLIAEAFVVEGTRKAAQDLAKWPTDRTGPDAH